jgi:hypothetical protein
LLLAAGWRASSHQLEALRMEKRITVSLDSRLHQFIQQTATDDDRTLSATVRRLIAKAAQDAGRHEPQERAA